MPAPEQKLLQQLQKLQTKRRESLSLSVENDTPQNSPHVEQAEKLEKDFRKKIEELKAKLWLFSKELPLRELKEQYEIQKEIHAKNNLLEPLSSGELGIRGIDRKEYPFPTLEQIKKELQNNKELKEKMEQGFLEIQITSFALPLLKLTEIVKQAIERHYISMPNPNDPSKRIPDPQRTKLFATKKDQNDLHEQLIPLELDEDQPLWIWDKYQNADENGTLAYFPKQFDQSNHQGRTKNQILQIQTNFPGYLVTLQEKNPNIPRENHGQETGHGKKRKQIEANGTPEEYLQKLQTDPQYQNESGLTPEEWLIKFLTHLEKTNQAIDDYQGNGSINYNLAGYFPASGVVSYAYWYRGNRQALLDRYDPRSQLAGVGARSAVRVGLRI